MASVSPRRPRGLGWTRAYSSFAFFSGEGFFSAELFAASLTFLAASWTVFC
jgi:hypothetical protein